MEKNVSSECAASVLNVEKKKIWLNRVIKSRKMKYVGNGAYIVQRQEVYKT